MKSRTITCITTLAVLAALGTTVRLAAQEQKEQKTGHHHYKLIDIGTLGGPNSGLSGPGFQIVNNRGSFAAFANTSTSNPNPNCFVPFNLTDCFVEHPVVLQNGALTDLGVLPGGANGQTTWISASGLIDGWSENGLIDPQTGQPESVAVLWEGGKIINLGTVPGGTESLAIGLNSHGHVVGFSNNDIPDPLSINGFPTQTRAFLWQNGVIKDLGTLGGPDAFGTFVNDSGQVVGFSYTDSIVNPITGSPTTHPFLWENGKMTDLGSLGGSLSSVFFFTLGGLNNSGQVVGASDLAGDLTTHPFLWSKSEGMKDLGTLGGTFGFSTYINDAGEVVGIATIPDDQSLHAFLWRDGGMTDLGTVGSDPDSEANSINSQGQVVGASFDLAVGVDLHGFLWEHSGPIMDLNTLVPPGSGVTITGALDINDRGEIAASGFRSNGDVHALLLIPCDEDHAGVAGCDYDAVDTAAAAQARPAQSAPPAAAASFAKLTPAEKQARVRSFMARHSRRPGARPQQ